jgi:hypothetical protein
MWRFACCHGVFFYLEFIGTLNNFFQFCCDVQILVVIGGRGYIGMLYNTFEGENEPPQVNCQLPNVSLTLKSVRAGFEPTLAGSAGPRGMRTLS